MYLLSNFLAAERSCTGWCESDGTVLLLTSGKTEMTLTIEIGLKIFLQHLCNQICIVFLKHPFPYLFSTTLTYEKLTPFSRNKSPSFLVAADV